MTYLHLESKIASSKLFSVSSLAKLSRGEFDEKRIADMENTILNTMGWHLHPPSVLSFLHHLCAAIPTTDERLHRKIFHHAAFFAELSVLNYFFVPLPSLPFSTPRKALTSPTFPTMPNPHKHINNTVHYHGSASATFRA
mmetsp:Transcript_44029/g.66340  ORF Transcript_44029/g.66340 Transcript_44029/m.66340 type:complete len:140 (+) Transcript_44029:1978-2397(+)